MYTKYYYKRVDVRGETYAFLSVLVGRGLLFFTGYIVLKQYRRHNYFVVKASRLKVAVGAAMLTHDGGFEFAQQLAEAALHQTAERFDTLEQAMLYYHAVS